MKQKNFSGILTALVTPFRDGELDLASLRKLVRFQLDAGIQGFVVNGTTGESPCLTEAERKTIFNCIKAEVAGQVPLIMGTGTNNTAETIRQTQQAEKYGADGALVVVPYYNKPPQRGLLAHFRAVAQSTALPMLLYNVPSRTITGLEVPTIAELAQVPTIVGIKEATGKIDLGSEIIAQTKNKNPSGFIVTSGDDGTFLQLTLVGGAGAIAVASHILPREFVDWQLRASAHDTEVLNDFAPYEELVSALYTESNPIPIKTALHLMGVIASPELRLPLMALAPDKTELLKNKMKKMELL